MCQRMAASISVTWDELHRSYFEEGKRQKRQKCEERKTALVVEMGSCPPTTCFPFMCRTIVLNTKRKNTKKKQKKQTKQILAGGFSWLWFLQRCFRSAALPVEGVVIVRVHVYSNLRHRLQRTDLRAENTDTSIVVILF